MKRTVEVSRARAMENWKEFLGNSKEIFNHIKNLLSYEGRVNFNPPALKEVEKNLVIKNTKEKIERAFRDKYYGSRVNYKAVVTGIIAESSLFGPPLPPRLNASVWKTLSEKEKGDLDNEIEKAYIYFVSKFEKEKAEELARRMVHLISVFHTANDDDAFDAHMKSVVSDLFEFLYFQKRHFECGHIDIGLEREYYQQGDFFFLGIEYIISYYFDRCFNVKLAREVIGSIISLMTLVSINQLVYRDNPKAIDRLINSISEKKKAIVSNYGSKI